MKQILLICLALFTTNAFSQSVTALPQDGSYNQSVAPQGAYRYQRQFYLITPAEMLKAGFQNGMVINSIGFTNGVAQSDTTKGKFKVYLQNSTNTVSRTDTNWTTASSATNSYHLGGLTKGSYDWQIISTCSGTTVDTATATFSNSNLTNCNAPTNLSTANITSSSAEFHWTSPANTVSKYIVQYSRIDTVNWLTDTVTANVDYVTGLLAGKNYQWRIKTLCAASFSDFSTVIFLTESVTAGCSIPAGLTAGSLTSTSTTISWTATSGASYYGIQFRRSGTLAWASNVSFSNSFNLTSLKAGTTYEYKVRTVCSSGNGAYSSASTFTTTGTTACYAPVTLSADSLTDSSAVLTWNSTGATSYTIRYRLKDFITWTNVITPMTLVHNDSILINESTGSYDVPFTNGTAFTYNGGGLYVAYEFADSSGLPAATPNIALCTVQNTVIKGSSGQDSLRFILSHNANQAGSLPGILKVTNLRPETRFGSPTMRDSVEVTNVYALGNNAIPYGNPSPVSARIRNLSSTSRTYSVTLLIKDQVTNATRFNPAAQNITVGAHATGLVNFSGWLPSISEKDSIIVSVPADSGETYTANNRNYYLQNNTKYVLSYDDGSGAITSAGFDTLSGLLLTKYTMNGCGKVNSAEIYLATSAKNHAVRAVVLNSSGGIVDSSAYFTPDSSQVDHYHSFYFPHTPLFKSADYYIGLTQLKNVANPYRPVGIQWEGTAVRGGAYYRASLTGSGITDSAIAGRLMIRAEIIPAVPVLTIGGQSSLCPGGTNVLTATTTSARFANAVIAVSSEASASEFGSAQALGSPDVYPAYTFNSNLWSGKTPDDQREYIELGFSNPAPVNYVDIYETYNPGAVDTIYVKNPGTGNYEVVYADSAVAAPLAARVKRVRFPLTSFNVSAIRIAVNSPRISGYNPIDAVAIGAINDSVYVANATYSWNGGATTQAINATTAAIYTVTVSDVNSCPQTASITLTNHASVTPVISASRTTTFCTGDTSVVLTSSQLTGNLWSTGATTRSITVSTTGNYTVSYNDSSGCAATTSAVTTVTVNPLPVVTITGSLTFCSGSSTTLNAGSGYNAYQWSTGASTQSITVSSAGSYSVTVTNANGCKGKQTVLTSAAALPSPVITGNTGFCPGSSTTLDAGAGYTVYQWSTGASTRTIAVSSAATYTVTVTNSSGCTKSTSVTTRYLSAPAPYIIGNNAFCPGSSTTLTANFGYSQYNWSTSVSTRSVNISTAGTFTVTVTDGNGCTGQASAVTQLYANPSPVISGSTTICPSSSTVLDAGTSFQTFMWSTGANTHAISVSNAGTYTVTVTDSNSCSGSTSISTTLNNSLSDSVGPITGQTFGLCNDHSKTYSVAAVPNATYYQWTIPAVDSIISGQGTTSINVYFRSFTIGSVSVVALNACGQSPVRTLEVNGAPVIPGTISGPPVVCRQNGKIYSIAAVAGATTYTWTVPTGISIVSGQGTTTVTVNVSSTFSTTGSVCVTASNTCGDSPARCYSIAAVPPVPASITGPIAVCRRQANVLYATAAIIGATTYTWTVPSGAKVSSGQGTSSVNVAFGSNAGNVAVNASNACGSSAYKSIAVTFNCREDGVTDLTSELALYPNPSNGNIIMQFQSAANDKYIVKVYDMLGNLLIAENVFAAEGLNQHNLDLTKAAKGMYFIKLEQNGITKSAIRAVVE